MSQILRLKSTLCLLRDIATKGQKCRILSKEGYHPSNCPSCVLSYQPLTYRSYSFTQNVLSNGSTNPKVSEGLSGRRRCKKRKPSTHKQKVETDLFKLLKARTSQLALHALKREAGEMDARYISDAIFIVPENADMAKIEEKVRQVRKALAESFAAQVIENPNIQEAQGLQSSKESSVKPEQWDKRLGAFRSQFPSYQTVDSDTGPDGASDRNSRLQDESSMDLNHNQSNISIASFPEHSAHINTSIPRLSDTNTSQPGANIPSFRDRVSVNANILKHKQNPKQKDHLVHRKHIPHEQFDAIPRHTSEIWEVEQDEVEKLVNEIPTKTETKRKSKSTKTSKELPEVNKKVEGTGNVVSKAKAAKLNRIFNQELSAYVDACCCAGLPSMAQSSIRFHHLSNTVVSHVRKIQDVYIYNTLMHAWAKQGKLYNIKKLFSFLRKDGIKPTMQTYAACLECLYHQEIFDSKMCERILQDIDKAGFELMNIFNECTFKNDERQIILKAILEVRPDFVPHPVPDLPPYTGRLLKDLNNQLPPEEVVERNPYAGVMTTEEMTRRMETQLQRELKGSISIKSIAKKSVITKKMNDYREKIESIKEDWREIFMRGIDRKKRYLAKRNEGELAMSLYPYMKVLPSRELADCMITEAEKMTKASDTFSPSMGVLWSQLGQRIYDRYVTQEKIGNKITLKTSKLYRQYASLYSDENVYPSHREQWQLLQNKEVDGSSLDVTGKPWPRHILKGISKMLYGIILYDLKIDANVLKSTQEKKMVPAFYTVYRTHGNRTHEEIKPNPVLVRLYEGAKLDDLTFNVAELPMLCPPIPWISQNCGGSLLGSDALIRLPDQVNKQPERLERLSGSSMYSVLDSLNMLGACAWIINKPILDLIISIFNKKGMKNLDIPPPVSECAPFPKISQKMTSQEKSKVFQERMKLRQVKSEMYSLWSYELYRLSIANTFRDDIFWFPHNMDFRGRTYPSPPHFNHLGSDVARSILLFAKGKPLGPRGLDWLKIHLVNLTGFKKRTSNADRLAFANENMSEILNSADKPLEGRKWWQGSDEPWQTLACCNEIANAVRCPDPTQYVSHLPVHQDGSCNGLQHYAALGRDQAGAESVNLYPFQVPQDVYSDVAELVEKVRQREAEEGVEMARLLKGFIRRKVIKQTVMTTVYGVTRFGAKHQILRQLEDIPEFPQEHVWAASSYLTQKTFQCLQEMFTATKQIQDWLTLCAHLISSLTHKPVEWVTPLGLLVLQPYHRPMSFTRFGVSVMDVWNSLEKPNIMKQKNGFPPNFIHSLDSTHMMLTSLYCLRAGINYVSVHDCFWTHPATVEVMNKVCREQFVSLHRQPILEDLSHYMLERFYNPEARSSPNDKSQEFFRSVLAQVPSRGTFDLDNVLKSTYFFS